MDVRTLEHGRFYVGTNGNRRFAGSASGVYLADTIRHKLSAGSQHDGGIMEAFISQMEGVISRVDEAQDDYSQYLLAASDLSDEGDLRDGFNHYFTTWHPLFPYLDGVHIRDAFNRCITNARNGLPIFHGMEQADGLVLTAILRSTWTIGSTTSGPNTPVFTDATGAMALANAVLGAYQSMQIGPVATVQALFAVELSLFYLRRFRPASHLSGTISKVAYESGLHRCPYRYPTTFAVTSERDLRKRLFYSIYVLERFLSKQLGFPLHLRDIDIDVCLPGAEEIHGTEVASHAPTASGKRKRTESSPIPVHPSNPGDLQETAAATPITSYAGSNKLLPSFSLAQLAGIIGRMMETFNGSRRWRAAESDDALRIRLDLDEWWMNYELDTQDTVQTPRSGSTNRYSTLFRCLYHQQIMHMYRHSLSLPLETVTHRNALQAETLASRSICASLSSEMLLDAGLLWPGYVNMCLDSALILMYSTKVSGRLSESRAAEALRQVEQTLDKLSMSWDGLQPVQLAVREFVRRLEPHGSGTSGPSNTPALPLDWLQNPDFNLEANPSGPDLFPFGNGMSTRDQFSALNAQGMNLAPSAFNFWPGGPWPGNMPGGLG